MKMLCKLVIMSALVMTAAFSAMAQQGQQQTPMMGQGTMGQGGMMGRGMQGMMGPGMQGMMMGSGPIMEGGLAYQKAELGITQDQTAAWDNYVAAFKARGTAMQSMHADMVQAMQTGSAMARMDAHIKAMESMVESLKALKPSTEALYAVLTDEQKQKADQLLGGGCGMMWAARRRR